MVTASVRRISAGMIGLVGALTLTAGCTSVSNGKPIAAGSVGGSTSVQSSAPGALPNTPSSAPDPLPSTAPGALPTSAPAFGGSSKFCRDLNRQGSLGSLGSSGDVSKVVAVWDKLTTEAPAEIKRDVRAVDGYLHDVLSGNIDPTAAVKLGTAVEHIGVYVATNCR